jgi:hypothetical protein
MKHCTLDIKIGSRKTMTAPAHKQSNMALLATTKTMQHALGIRHALEKLVSELGNGNFKDKVGKSSLSQSDKDLVEEMWDWSNKYMHPQPDGLHPNMLATAGKYESWIKGTHKFKLAN